VTSTAGARSLWQEALPITGNEQRRIECHDLRQGADVVVVGAGFTGLWTAYHLLRRDLSQRVLILDAHSVGFGASGRNGGWCTPEIPLSLDTVDDRHGAGAAYQWRSALVDTVNEIRSVCDAEGIDAQWADGGWVQWARNTAQEQRLRALVDEFRRHGFDDAAMRWMDADEARTLSHATGVRGAGFSSQTAALHPGRLVHGLAAAVERQGGVIVEGARVEEILPHAVRVAGQRVPARWVVRATEAYGARLPGFRRSVLPVYSMMIATAPLPAATWEEVGLDRRTVFNDARRTVIYGQRTADGRLAFGGRGAPYHIGSRIEARYDRHLPTRDHLAATLTELFPALSGVEITHHWGGPLGIHRDWHPGVGVDATKGWAWAGGYVGEGVVAAALAGRTLADLVTSHVTAATAVAWVGHRSRRWEPEPLRWLGSRAMVALARCADGRDDREAPSIKAVDAVLGRLLGH
jgi:glycine/D-amino acid oxidase-like deaminating enzyme